MATSSFHGGRKPLVPNQVLFQLQAGMLVKPLTSSKIQTPDLGDQYLFNYFIFRAAILGRIIV